MQKVTSTEIKKALAGHAKGYFITECKTCSTYFPDPQGMLKFDGLEVARSYTAPCITGYEIKVSRSDFLGDSKWHLYLQYCHEFYFVVPAGLVEKEEIPDSAGLVYYYPETGKLLKKKKALYRRIEEPVGVYRYIIYSRLDRDRVPFYESRAEYAKDYLADRREKRRIGDAFGSRMAEDLRGCQERLERLKNVEGELELLSRIEGILKKHRLLDYWGWPRDTDSILEELDSALGSSYPEDLGLVEGSLQNALDTLKRIRESHMEDKGEDGDAGASGEKEMV